MRDRRLHDVVERHDLLLEVVAERLGRDPAEVDLPHERTGRVYHRVHTAELPGHPVDEGRGRRGVEQVDLRDLGAATRRHHVGAHRAGRDLVAPVRQGDVAPPLGQQPADRGAEAAAPAGDDGRALAIAEVVHSYTASVRSRCPRRPSRSGGMITCCSAVTVCVHSRTATRVAMRHSPSRRSKRSTYRNPVVKLRR